MQFGLADGSYEHVRGQGPNGMATEQAAYGLTSLMRSMSGMTRLYDMGDVALAPWPLPAPPVSKAALATAIALAETKVPADYSPASWAAFALALNSARSVNADVQASQADVDAAVAALAAALAALAPPVGPGQPVVYAVTSGFAPFDGSGSRSAVIDADVAGFVSLKLAGAVVSPADYGVTPGSVVITLGEVYLKTFSNGTYTFRAEFDDGYADLVLVVNKAGGGGTGPGNGNGTGNGTGSGNGSGANAGAGTGGNRLPRTGDGSLALLIVMAACLACGGVSLISSRLIIRSRTTRREGRLRG
jgi:hypothetical protein